MDYIVEQKWITLIIQNTKDGKCGSISIERNSQTFARGNEHISDITSAWAPLNSKQIIKFSLTK